MNNSCNKIKYREKANDKIYTPINLAKIMIDLCEIKNNDIVLDPCRGKGAFYNNLPKCKKYYCEIDENKDFFDWDKKVDLIIGNPPYSLWNKWIEHTMKYCNKFCYIFGFLNFMPERIDLILNEGFKIKKMILCKVAWWFGQSIIVLFEKNYNGKIEFDNIRDRIQCDICNKKCHRGLLRGRGKDRRKYGMNECSNIKHSKEPS